MSGTRLWPPASSLASSPWLGQQLGRLGYRGRGVVLKGAGSHFLPPGWLVRRMRRRGPAGWSYEPILSAANWTALTMLW